MDLLLITILGTLTGTLLALEAKAWMPYVSGRLVRSTFKRMPDRLDEGMRLRWQEEIEADLNSYADRPFGGLFFALRLRRRGGRRLAAELMLSQTLKRSSDDEVKSDRNSDLPGVARIRATVEDDIAVLTYEYTDGRIVRETAADSAGDFVVDRELNERLRAGEMVEVIVARDHYEEKGKS